MVRRRAPPRFAAGAARGARRRQTVGAVTTRQVRRSVVIERAPWIAVPRSVEQRQVGPRKSADDVGSCAACGSPVAGIVPRPRDNEVTSTKRSIVATQLLTPNQRRATTQPNERGSASKTELCLRRGCGDGKSAVALLDARQSAAQGAAMCGMNRESPDKTESPFPSVPGTRRAKSRLAIASASGHSLGQEQGKCPTWAGTFPMTR